MSDAPKHAVNAATLVLVEALRSPEASKTFALSKGDSLARQLTECHEKLVQHFSQYPEHDAEEALARSKAMSS
ncbi:hypothetical protein [Salinicola halophilus]|uniref:hypothetical protein n=1 Tax=Salinicola halophilus TaxID=184065 RepID=UPI000DA1D13B|nr:hypothetical protein [Salinicola halophilus]